MNFSKISEKNKSFYQILINNTIKTIINQFYRKPGIFLNEHEILYDHLKLKNAEEADLRYMLIFTNTTKNEIDYFRNIELNKDIQIIYVAVYEKDRRKVMKVRQIPENWIKL